ncbi:hypothetical protein BDZ89DRAFT_490296 [Hymenopellis radicata]|nr:hypothetical protein BDZ89DRAFT_490296 [Hymenopellis radicata]
MDTDGWHSDDEHSTEWRGPTAVRIYDGVSFLGFFALLLTLLPATLSKRIHRTRPWYSFIASWMVFAFSFLLLVNNQIEDTPHFGTCVLQMVMVYSSPVLVGTTGVAFIMDTIYTFRGLVLGTTNSSHVYRDLMIIMPWVLWILMIMVTLFLIGKPEQIQRDSTHMFCHSTSSAQLIVTLCMAFPLTAGCIVLELYLVYFLYRNWVAFRIYISDQGGTRQHRQSVSMMVRLAVFTTMPLIALGLAAFIAAHERESTALWNILLASVPITAALSFGTQKDILQFYNPRHRPEDEDLIRYKPVRSPPPGSDWGSRRPSQAGMRELIISPASLTQYEMSRSTPRMDIRAKHCSTSSSIPVFVVPSSA